MKLIRIAVLASCFMVLVAVTGAASTFVVDPNGNPAVDFPDLATAFATISGYAGTHDIEIREAAYSDANLTVPSNIVSITGEDGVVFTAPLGTDNFLDLTNVPSGFVISAIQMVGYNFTLYGNSIGATIEDCQFLNATGYGVALYASSTGNTVQDNCFVGGPTPQGYDSAPGGPNTWTNNYFDDATSASSYALAGGAGNTDGDPAVFDNSAAAEAGSYALGDEFTVNVMWTAPTCVELDPTALAAYDFSVNYNAAKLQYVGAAYDKAFLGETVDGAAYTPIAQSSGSVQFAAINFTNPGEGSGRLATVTFRVIAANTSTAVTVGSSYKDQDNNDIVVQNTPLNLGLVDNTPPVMAPIVPNDPAGDDTYSDGSSAGAGPFVKMYLQYSASDDYNLAKLQYSLDGAIWYDYPPFVGLSGTTFTNAPDSAYINLPGAYGGPDGDYSFYVRAIDQANNISNVEQYDFTTDRTAPVLTSIVLADPDGCAPDPEYTNENDVRVTFTASGSPTMMEFYESGWAGPIAYTSPYLYPFVNTTEGLKTIYSRLYDKYNNMGNQVSDQITLDNSAPAPTGWLLAGGAAKTNTAAITGAVGFYGGSGVFQLNFSPNAGDLVCGNGGWTALVNPVNTTLLGDDGTKTIYYATRDQAGNISALLSDDIVLDRAGADFSSFAVVDQTGDDCSDSWTVDVVVDWTAPDVAYLGLKTTGGYTWYNVTGQTPPYTQAYTIAGGSCDADNTVYGVLVDDINNYGTEASASIFVDCAAPTIASVEMKDLTTGSSTWSNEATVDVDIAGAADIVAIAFSEDNVTYGSWIDVDMSGGPITEQYTFGSPVTENAYLPLWVKAMDCAGRTGVGQDAAGIIFDLTDPVISTVSINGGAAKTNNPLVSVAITVVEVYPMTVTLSQNADFSGPTTVSYAFGGPYAFTFTAGDGVRTVHVKLDDYSGNVSAAASDDIILDQTPPSGTINIVSTNPLAAPEYTSTSACVLNLTWDADVDQFAIRNLGSPTWTYVSPAGSPQSWTINWVYGWQKVEATFHDFAGNWGPTIYDSIFADGNAPLAPANAWGTPGGSLLLGWDAVPNAQYYMLRYNYNGDYPEYAVPNPPAPGPTQGFLAADHVVGTSFDFEGPQPDIYTFSIWTMGKNGLPSVLYNTDVTATNYVLGDFYDSEASALGPDGCIDFGDEFGALASAYRTNDGDTHFNHFLDIGPTFTGAVTSYPVPDNAINFNDLVIFGLDYRDYKCSGVKRFDVDKPAVTGPIALSVELPSRVEAGTDYTVSVTADRAAAIFAYHAVLDYNRDAVEVVSVNPGGMYSSVEQSFFYYDTKADNLDISSIILGDDMFSGEEMFTITFRAKSSGIIDLKDVELDFRNASNEALEVGFAMSKQVELPTSFALSQNYPNPFNPSTNIDFSLPVASSYTLTIYNIAGQVVESFAGQAEAGTVTIVWDAAGYGSGVYFYKLEAGTFAQTRKMVLLK